METETETEVKERNVEESTGNKRLNDSPPDDDCCPICFGSFTVPCRSNCGHWYCGSCILQFWNYSSASKPCKCPMCASKIVNLMPEASLQQQQDREVTQVLKSVQRYNLLFVGGALGFIQLLLSIIYRASPYDFLPTGGVGIGRVFDFFAIGLVLILRLVGIYRRRQLMRRVRQVAAMELLQEGVYMV